MWWIIQKDFEYAFKWFLENTKWELHLLLMFQALLCAHYMSFNGTILPSIKATSPGLNYRLRRCWSAIFYCGCKININLSKRFISCLDVLCAPNYIQRDFGGVPLFDICTFVRENHVAKHCHTMVINSDTWRTWGHCWHITDTPRMVIHHH